jgi:4-diphosphocytidyl-2-C-methyl-D-erythritol kinase
MIVFPNCKINIGLNVCEVRPDGFHNIETVFYPVPWTDILEIVASDKEEFIFDGLKIECKLEENLCYKAYHLLKKDFAIPPIKLFLYKIIPSGAGLGGGSSDAAFTLMTLNNLFSLNLDEDTLMNYATKLGSDCAFFIKNKAVYAIEKGNLFSEISIELKGYFLLIIKPKISIATATAYKMVTPVIPAYLLKDSITIPITQWKSQISNDFEAPVFKIYKELKEIKDKLYSLGAVYASMSGSGSAIFGLFNKKIDLKEFPDEVCWMKQL